MPNRLLRAQLHTAMTLHAATCSDIESDDDSSSAMYRAKNILVQLVASWAIAELEGYIVKTHIGDNATMRSRFSNLLAMSTLVKTEGYIVKTHIGDEYFSNLFVDFEISVYAPRPRGGKFDILFTRA